MSASEKRFSIPENAAEMIGHLVTKPEIECKHHKDRKAFISCSACACGICFECLKDTKEPAGFVCAECGKSLEKGNGHWDKILGAFKFPVSWVLLCIIFAGIAYAKGLGNPDIGKIAEADKARPWHMQKTGKIFLSQSGREKQRAAALRVEDKISEAERWNSLAASTFAKTAEFWKNTPVYADLKIAEAVMLSDSGKNSEGIRILNSLTMDSENPSFASFNFYLGTLYEKEKNREKSEIHFKKAFEISGTLGDGFIFDKMLDKFAEDRKSAEMIIKVRTVCETNIANTDIAEKCRKHLGVREEKSAVVNPEEKKFPGLSGNKTGFEVEFINEK